MAKQEFYDVKAKAKVKADVVAKKQFANGRYAVLGKTADGRDLYRFVTKEAYDKCAAPACAAKCCKKACAKKK